jgi:zinc protease
MRGFLFALLLLVLPASLAAREPARPADDNSWAFDSSDIPLDPAFHFGRLDNGMRYIVRHNATPAGTAVVRMLVEAGSLDENEDELGYAHFVEHMAFNGSKRVPEGQMVALLERNGLAFGADTNASTNFDRTLYKLDLPRSDPALLDTALMLMRETAGELTISQGEVDRERGVILSEMRDRNTFSLRNAIDGIAFFYPQSLYSRRLPIGTAETIHAASAASLRAFYEREYVPAHVTLVVVGDFDVAQVVAGIQRHFGDWRAKQSEPQPGAGPIAPGDKRRTDIYIDPALSERVSVVRSGPWLDEPDSVAQRQENLLRSIGYDIVNRRLQRLSRQEKPPFRGAGFGTGDVFEAARSTRLIVDTVDRHWRKGLLAAAAEYRRALAHGFTAPEVAEQVASIRTSLINAAGSADTRSNDALAGSAMALVTDRTVPSTPQTVLQRFEAFAPRITPEAVLAALKREALRLRKPLIRFEGRFAPEGGAEALREAWKEAMKAPLDRSPAAETMAFAYTDFGPAGKVVSDRIEPRLGIREVRFTNGVMLNLKRTDIEQDKVRVSVSIDGGDMLDTPGDPLATEMVSYLDEGGLGRHSRDELETILAGRTVGFGLRSGEASFEGLYQTTPRDLQLQLELAAALITDPGYRTEGQVQYRQQVNNYFARLRATPASALQADLGTILSAGDPRFSLQPVQSYRQLSYEKLKNDIGDRLARGAIEVGIVGDFDEDQVIAQVARTLGALPPREPSFREYADQPPHRFSPDRAPRVIRHGGAADQALLRLTWPTRDDSDPVETLKLELLERVMRIELTDELREALGKAYSPSASSSLSRHWKGYGVFSINASVDVADVAATRKSIDEVVQSLRSAPVSDDILQRARQPMLEGLQNALKSNSGWLSLVNRAQTEGERIDRYVEASSRLKALNAADLQAMAQRYLDPAEGLEVLVLPEGVDPPE